MLRNDRIRQVVITASAVFMIIGTLFGIGVIGTRVEEAAGGSLSATATLVAPAVNAFSIWSVIYAGLIAYVVWQWLPANTTSARARSIGWLAAASMVLNASWLLVTQVGWLWASVAVIVALALVLGELVRRLTALPADADRPATTWAERFIVDGTFGLYLGWVSVATVANITATLVDSGVNPAAPGLGVPGCRGAGGGRCAGRHPGEGVRRPVRRGRGHGLGPGLDRCGTPHRRAGVHAHRGGGCGRGGCDCRGGGGRPAAHVVVGRVPGGARAPPDPTRRLRREERSDEPTRGLRCEERASLEA